VGLDLGLDAPARAFLDHAGSATGGGEKNALFNRP
jgi:hypothetical protein